MCNLYTGALHENTDTGVFIRDATGAKISGCERCEAGTVSNADFTGCDPCPAGTFANGVCEPCAAGEYQDEEKQASCKACDVGHVSDAGATSCDPCAGSGEFANGNVCEACPLGTAASVPVDVCPPCGAGTFRQRDRHYSCFLCEAGTYQEQTGQTSCVLRAQMEVRAPWEPIYWKSAGTYVVWELVSWVKNQATIWAA